MRSPKSISSVFFCFATKPSEQLPAEDLRARNAEGRSCYPILSLSGGDRLPERRTRSILLDPLRILGLNAPTTFAAIMNVRLALDSKYIWMHGRARRSSFH